MIYKKNTAVIGFCFSLESINGSNYTDGTVEAFLVKDGVFSGNLSNIPAYDENAHCWMINLDSTELNAN